MRNTLFSTSVILSGWVALALPAFGFEIESENRFDVDTPSQILEIISTADIDSFAPLIIAFQQRKSGRLDQLCEP